MAKIIKILYFYFCSIINFKGDRMKNNINIESQFVSGTTDDKFIVKYNGDTNANVDRNKLYEMIRNYKEKKKLIICLIMYLF